MQNIYATIRQEINDFIYNSIEPVDGWNFNQYDTIKRAHLYLNSQFWDNSLYNGKEKIFYNITTPRRDLVARFLDVDTKDIKIEELNQKSEIPVYLLNYELKRFMSEVNFSKTLNQLAEQAVSYGSVVLKTKRNAEPEIVDLRRLFLDPTVDTITKSRFITIKHFLTEEELREKTKDGWDADAIEALIRRRQEKSNAPESYEDNGNLNVVISSPYFEVYERYGYVPERMLNGGKSEKSVYSLFIVGEPFNQDEKGNENGEVLFKSKWTKEPPFKDYHFVKTAGRWLGIGVPEILFAPQERFNELANQKRVSMELSTLHLFQTSDPTVYNNILTDLENGDIIKTKTPNALQPIVNEERNLPAFNVEEQAYKNLADSVSFSNDILMGGEIPSTMPATNAVLQNNNPTKVHLQKRENFCNFIRYYVKDFTIPELIRRTTDKHILKLTGDATDLAFYDEKFINLKIREQILSGKIRFKEEADALSQVIGEQLKKQGGKRYVEVLENYYKEKLQDFDVNVDGEQKDLSKLVQNTFQFYSVYAQNPEALNDPVQKELMLQYANDLGLDTNKIELAFAKRQIAVSEGQSNPTQTRNPKGGNTRATQENPDEELAGVL